MKATSLFFLLVILAVVHVNGQSGAHIDPEIQVQPVDTSAIVLELEVTVHSISLLKLTSESVNPAKLYTFTKGSLLKITSAGNSQASTSSIFVKFNQAPEQQYEEPVRLVAKGKHTVSVRATDKSGRESTFELKYRIIE